MSIEKIIGDKNIIANLNMIKKSVKNRILRKALVKALAPVKAKAKNRVNKRSGMLAKSIKVKATKNGNAKVYVDPKNHIVIDGKKVNPSKYAHLVEFGTVHSAAAPFMRNSMDESRSAVFSEVGNEVRIQFDKEAARFKTGAV